jgi:hypothetical protein
MTPTYWEVAGEIIPSDLLSIDRAREFTFLILSDATPNARVVETRKNWKGREVVVVEVRPTVPQKPSIPIHRIERVSVEFGIDDAWYPDVRALRTDFPRERVLHLNGGIPSSEPVSLCLFSQSWADVKLTLTANELLFRIQNWFDDSAKGSLHRDDQPLEPAFLARPVPLVVSPTLLDKMTLESSQLDLLMVESPAGNVYIQQRGDRRPTGIVNAALVLAMVSEPHEHFVINDGPRTLEELHMQLEPVGIDLLDLVQKKLLGLGEEARKYGLMVFLILLQRKRHAGSEPEPELAAFFCMSKDAQANGIRGIFRELGFTSSDSFDKTKRGQNVPVMYLSVRFELTPATASDYSGNEEVDASLIAVGAGAIGSQLVMNAVRGGMTNWHLIDDDFLLPHNLVRHSLTGDWIGHPKVVGVACESNNMFDKPCVKATIADVLNPGDKAAEVNSALESATAIIDLSASVAVARHLTREALSSAPRCSIFISPSGNDLVFLGEDRYRRDRLDSIEAQYYRALLTEPKLKGHLLGGSSVGSCRAMTSRVPQHMVAIHSAQGLRTLRTWLKDRSSRATVVRAVDASLEFRQVDIPIGSLIEIGCIGGWMVISDSIFLDTLQVQREDSLPNETGGVLLAHVDAQRKTLYVCHQIPAPEDSERQPTVYIRGASGLAQEYARVRAESLNGLAYIGEWHSHPNGCECSPSQEDLLAGAWLAEQTRPTSLPGLMLIVGERNQTCWMLCSQPTDCEAPILLSLTWKDVA